MDWRDSLIKAAKAPGQKMLRNVRRLSRAPRPDTAIGALVPALSSLMASALAGVVTDLVTSQRGWGLTAAVVTLVSACIVLSRLATPVPNTVPAGDVPTDHTRYGVLPGTAGPLGRLVSTVMSSAYGEFPTGSAEPGPEVNLVNECRELDPPSNSGRSLSVRFLLGESSEVNPGAGVLPLTCLAARPGFLARDRGQGGRRGLFGVR